MVEKQPLLEQMDSTPLVERARTELLHAILDHRFEDKLPPENVLAEMLNVSRTTVRAALQGLEQNGLIVRRRSIGTTINRHLDVASMALQRMVGFDWLLEEQGYAVETASEWSVGHGDPKLLGVFDLDTSADYLLSEKSYTADGAIAIHIRDIVPVINVVSGTLADLGGLTAAGPSLFEVSAQYLTHPIQGARAQIVPMVKNKQTDTQLDIARNTAFVRLHERHLSSDGQLLAYSVVDVDNRYVRFDIYRRR